MAENFYIRDEKTGDAAAIHDLTSAAFEGMPHSDGSEPRIVDQLREDGDLTLSLVAERDDEIIGHIAFSPAVVANDTGVWYGLGPVSVKPDSQRSGIGTALINHGLQHIKTSGAGGCVLIGDPDYYSRFGFAGDGRITWRDIDTAYVQWLSFAAPPDQGEIRFAPAMETHD